MDENQRKGPGEAANDGRAQHGYRNEVTWEDGKGRQPYANQGEEEAGPGAAAEVEGGNRGAASGRTLEQVEQLRQDTQPPRREPPRGS